MTSRQGWIKTEDRILSNIQNNYPDITLISITQKIEPVKDFDQIILLMGGEIIASGQHESLMKSCPSIFRFINHNKAPNSMNYNLNREIKKEKESVR